MANRRSKYKEPVKDKNRLLTGYKTNLSLLLVTVKVHLTHIYSFLNILSSEAE